MNSKRLRYCKVCTNRKTNASVGLLCGLTGKVADFEDECDDFDFDDARSNHYKKREANIEAQEVTLPFGLNHHDKEKFSMLSYGLIAIVISLIVLITNWQEDFSWLFFIPLLIGIATFVVGIIKGINPPKDC